MSDQERREQLKAALQTAGSAWLLDVGGDAGNRLDQILSDLDAFAAEYKGRFGGEKPDPLALLHQDQYSGKAFLQADTFMVSTEMKIMIWRILMGCEIQRVHLDYELGKKPNFTVVLRTPDEKKEEEYHGTETWDFRVLRHFGATGVKPIGATQANMGLVLQGYYAFQ